jgi:cytochrome b6-f complex iron-sulfur subunit
MSDCPQEPEPNSSISRRAFLRAGAAAAGACYAAALGYPVYEYLATAAHKAEAEGAQKEVVLNDIDKLPIPSALMFKFGGRPALLIRHGESSWTALSAVCTHLGCTVQFSPEKNQIFCACHGGIYDPATGANVSGPPPKPLSPYRVVVDQGKAVISRA